MSYATTVLADSPTAYWRLGEAAGTTAVDETTTHDGTYVNTPTLGAAGAVDDANTAVTFVAASEEYVTTSTLGTLGANLGTSSWEFWVKTTTAATQAILGTVTTGSTSLVRIYTNSDGNLTTVAGSTSFAFRDSGANTRSGYITDSIYDGQWHHVVVVVTSSTTVAVYVDGVSRTVTYSNAGTLGATNNFDFPLTLAANNGRGTIVAWLDGTLDEVAVYPTRLSAARIQAHYAVGSSDSSLLLLGIG